MELMTRVKNAYNAFMNRDPTKYANYGPGYSYRPDRPRMTRGNDRTILTAINNRIAIDVALMTFQHCKMNDKDQYDDIVNDGLNKCLNLEANLDQSAFAFKVDMAMSMLDEGCVAVAPIETDKDTINQQTGSYEIYTMRTGKVTTWYPDAVRVRMYDDRDGQKKETVMMKKDVALVENPFFSIMNEPNSTAKRLAHKLALLDRSDDYNASGNIDLIIQLPYTVKSERKKAVADQRRAEIEEQLSGSTYGVAYIDSTEHVIQLNRALENNLLKQIDYLTNELFTQLNMTPEILNGTADERTMQNYYSRTIEPIATAFVEEMKRKFLTKTAIAQKHTIMYFRDPFKMLPISQVAELADKLTRNEIMSSNEIRTKIGMRPSKDKAADQLKNSNISAAKNRLPVAEPASVPAEELTNKEKEEQIQNG